MNTIIPNSDAALLRWRTRDTARHLLLAFIASFAIALTSGALLWVKLGHGNFVQVLLVTHLVSGLLALFFFVPFVAIHWRDGREPLLHMIFPFRLLTEARRDHLARHRLLGHGLLWTLAIVLLSGLVVMLPALAYLAGRPVTLPYGGHVRLLQIHVWATPALLLFLLLHLPKEDRQ
jgi:hypothetical protein